MPPSPGVHELCGGYGEVGHLQDARKFRHSPPTAQNHTHRKTRREWRMQFVWGETFENGFTAASEESCRQTSRAE
jgi:hypothetical protein